MLDQSTILYTMQDRRTLSQLLFPKFQNSRKLTASCGANDDVGMVLDTREKKL